MASLCTQASDIAIRAKEILKNRETALELMSRGTGVTIEQLSKDTNRWYATNLPSLQVHVTSG